MIRRNLTLFFLVLCACLAFSFAAIKVSNFSNELTDFADGVVHDAHKIAPPLISENAIQVALLLDTSGSMDGLIEQAKSQLWNILNELSRAGRNDQEADLQIALYEYGNPSSADRGIQINQLSEFTNDMDMISEKLFSLTTDGGQEYCGAVIQRSLEDLNWSNGENLKMIYIAGNEPFTQGPVNYAEVCKRAKSQGIVVNTIFCGDKREGINGFWEKGAQEGGGEFVSIVQNDETVYISTPYDDEIDKLNIQLNGTYIPYGHKGNQKKENQVMQDLNARNYSRSNVADRASFKSSKKYKADDWDLVDAYKKDKSILKNADIKSVKYNAMTIQDLEENIVAISEERESIQSEIRGLDKKRREYKVAEAKKAVDNKADSFQESILRTIKKQAEIKGYEIKD